jgi:hypothetical protein
MDRQKIKSKSRANSPLTNQQMVNMTWLTFLNQQLGNWMVVNLWKAVE